MDTTALRQKLLDLAIRGRLVPQNPDEPAVELDAKDTVPESEQPFKIPENWRWVGIGDTVLCRDGERIPVKASDREKQKKIYDYYGAAGVIDKVENYLFDKRLLLVGEDGANLLSRRKPNAFFADGKYWVNNHAHILDETPLINLDFLANYINAISLSPYVTGTAQPKLTQKKLLNIPLPLPPLPEQERIVAKLEQLFEVIDRCEEAQKQIVDTATQLRTSLLQAAIRGKLVPQDPDEPAIELDAEDTVPESEQPFEIPENWRWVKLNNVSSIVRGGSPRPIKDFLTDKEEGINWIKIGDSVRGSKYISHCKEKILPTGVKRSRFVRKGTLILTNSMSFGYPYILDLDGCIHDGWLAFSDFEKVLSVEFLYYVLLSPYCHNEFSKSAAGAVVKNLNIDKVKTSLIPIPPLPEQERIAVKLEQLFAAIDTIQQAAI